MNDLFEYVAPVVKVSVEEMRERYPEPPKPTGQQLAEEGGHRALDHAERVEDDWGNRAYAALVAYSRFASMLTIEQVKEEAYNHGLPEPPAPGAWGPVTKRAKKEGLIEFLRFNTSANATQHGKPVILWRVK